MLLELAWPKARDRSCNKNRMRKMKRGPHSQQPIKSTSLSWIIKEGRLLAWIGDQVRLKAFTVQQRAFIYKRRHSLVLN